MATFSDRVAVVTAAGSPLGAAAALRLARDGASLVLVDRDGDAMRATAARFMAAATRIETVIGDPRDKHTAISAVHAAEKRFGRIDILVNQVSYGGDAPFPDQDLAAWSEVFETIVRGTFHFCREISKNMIQKRVSGRIINVTGIHGARGEARASNHASAKAAVDQFTRCLAVELAPHHIRVNAVAAGLIEAPAGKPGDKPVDKADEQPSFFAKPDDQPATAAAVTGTQRFMASALGDGRVPIGRAARPEEIAAAIAFLASPDASYINGHVLVVDGGLSASL